MIRFDALYEALYAAYGPQGWWPADDAFEIVVGAVLVQRTTWHNAAAALDALRVKGLLTPAALARAELAVIEGCVRRAGFYRSKTVRLRGIARFVIARGGFGALSALSTDRLRQAWLDLEGVGPETADSILLYAFGRPAVVIDEYLRRLVRRLAPADAKLTDSGLRAAVADSVDDSARLNELHALVIAHGKAVCGARPRCEECVLRRDCRTGRAASEA